MINSSLVRKIQFKKCHRSEVTPSESMIYFNTHFLYQSLSVTDSLFSKKLSPPCLDLCSKLPSKLTSKLSSKLSSKLTSKLIVPRLPTKYVRCYHGNIQSGSWGEMKFWSLVVYVCWTELNNKNQKCQVYHYFEHMESSKIQEVPKTGPHPVGWAIKCNDMLIWLYQHCHRVLTDTDIAQHSFGLWRAGYRQTVD